MDKYRIENVRGCSYTKIKLDEHQIKTFEFRTVNNLYLKCGKHVHFAYNCINI